VAKPRVRVPDDEALRRITTRAVAEIVPHQEFLDGLRSGRPLRLKMGFDPTKPIITLGWAVGLRKLRQLQDLGHTVVVIIGDWTARIGDPSGASQTRPMLTADEVQANSQAILRQFYKVLDERRTEIRRQSEWFDKFDLTEVVRLAARFTVAQVLQRDDFAQRFADHKPIGIHELVYPLLQGYDSFAVEADVEFGGTDQKFNNLVGRELQRMLGQKAGPAGEGQAVFLVPLLVGLDGTQKMSQSLGNFIGIDDPPHDMYGKLMSIPDGLILDYYELLTDVPDDELRLIDDALQEHSGHPAIHVMNYKLRLAREIVSQFHSKDAAQAAQTEFESVFRERGLPEHVQDFRMSFRDAIFLRESLYYLPRILLEAGVASSISEAARLIRQGAVDRMEGERVERVHSLLVALNDRDTFRVGKHRFLRIVDADKHPED
jgi:tyrosyl-tRNA synthetase